MLCLLLKWIENTGYLGIGCKCSVMFVSIVMVNLYEIITYPLGYKDEPIIFFREGVSKSNRVSNTFEKYFFIAVSNFILMYRVI